MGISLGNVIVEFVILGFGLMLFGILHWRVKALELWRKSEEQRTKYQVEKAEPLLTEALVKMVKIEEDRIRKDKANGSSVHLTSSP